METIPKDIRAFFDQYREAFDRLDGEAVARLYAVPSGIADEKSYEHWPAFEPIRKNMVALCDLYRDEGYEAATFEPVAFIAQGEKFAVADLAWTISRTNGREPWKFNTTYNVMHTSEGWRVLLCTAYSEKKLPAEATCTSIEPTATPVSATMLSIQELPKTNKSSSAGTPACRSGSVISSPSNGSCRP